MDARLKEVLSRSGATLEPGSSRPLHFGDAARELQSALDRCVVADRSDLGRILATGPDLLDLLNRLSTKTVRNLSTGRGCATVLTSSKGRIVERLFVHHLGEKGVLLVTGRGSSERAIAHLNKYTFAEDCGLCDVTASWCQLALIGPRASEALRAGSLPVPDSAGAASAELEGVEVHVLGEDGHSTGGFSLTAPADRAPRIWTALVEAASAGGGQPAGDQAVEAWRVLRGLGASGHELTEDHNPLEAGLWDAVDFEKGCYVGQEVVARLNTYDKVARGVKGFVLPADDPKPEVGTPLFVGSRKVGEVTSALVPPGRRSPVALAYVKRDFFEAGTELRLGADESAPRVRLIDPPFGETP